MTKDDYSKSFKGYFTKASKTILLIGGASAKGDI